MRVDEAKALLDGPPIGPGRAQRWMDLGCGDGTFTRALAELLPPGGRIDAWDTNASALRGIPAVMGGTRIHTRVADFTRTALPSGLDGVLLANALHYVQDADRLLTQVHRALHNDGFLLIAEYDTDVPVATWVPYPVSLDRLRRLCRTGRFAPPQELRRRPSVYGHGDLYTAFARRTHPRP